MAVHITLRNQTQRTKRNGSYNEFAKFVILVALTTTTDAFQSIALRSLHAETIKLTGYAQRFDYLNLRRRRTQTFTKVLRAAVTLDAETAYNVAQVRHLYVDPSRYLSKKNHETTHL